LPWELADMTDARIVHTTHALEQAVLAIAAVMPASRISVSELCARAQVTRRTFYNRFDTPAQVLVQVLRRDLAELPARNTEDGSPEELLRRANGDIIDHVLRHREVYRQALLASADGGVFEVLVDRFVSYSTAFIRRSPAPPMPREGIRLVAQFVSHGFAGAIKAWLSDPTITREVLEDAVATVAPAWWK
jgi:AcrR family transcriptional regulator